MHGLKRPEATQEEWRLQLGLTEADHLRSDVFEKIVDDLLFGLLVETSDIEGDESELLPIGFHFREISLNPRFIFVGECISPVFSVICSTPTISLILVLGLLVPRCSIPAQSCYLTPSRNSHDMTDSSLTTPLPHLKSLYYTHMGGLAVSGSHWIREFFEKSECQHSLRTPCWYPTVH
jgi:hypothetical protein